ncbi:dTDP-4-dehydrorhamnose 3,5-epimerase [Fusobacterium varium]|uniref:dTDP-4-dehydrorhamnose 3,5-epimerase n=1 Tax=Fusobacterium varium TaxID=856 RepID=UPI001F42D740|nr:dTDP-4-dehydrorhamnose 3,5-epimerase [Fusobacterium varium]MCF2674257.1 dTDP-4-dehydrorhamnose 3,5-epimerase [Fusobacterium varium]
MKFEIIEQIEDIKIIKINPFEDERGKYIKMYSEEEMEKLGLTDKFVEDNYLISKKGTIRGLHFQSKNPEAKLIMCLKGRILDIVVDVRKKSKNYGKFYSFELNEADKKLLYIPIGYAHGFLSIEDSEVIYKSSNYYYPDDQHGISVFCKNFNLGEILIKYSITELIMTEKDKNLDIIKKIKNE